MREHDLSGLHDSSCHIAVDDVVHPGPVRHADQHAPAGAVPPDLDGRRRLRVVGRIVHPGPDPGGLQLFVGVTGGRKDEEQVDTSQSDRTVPR